MVEERVVVGGPGYVGRFLGSKVGGERLIKSRDLGHLYKRKVIV